MQVVSARIKPKIPVIPINPPGPARAPRKGVYQAIKNPEAVRFSFSNDAIGNLFSSEGLPVAPFRTDKWEY